MPARRSYKRRSSKRATRRSKRRQSRSKRIRTRNSTGVHKRRYGNAHTFNCTVQNPVAVYEDGTAVVSGKTVCEPVQRTHLLADAVTVDDVDGFVNKQKQINDTLSEYEQNGYTILQYQNFEIGDGRNPKENNIVSQSDTDKYVAHLPENRTTGFKWRIEEGNAYINQFPFQNPDPHLVGAPGTFAILTINNRRPVVIYRSRSQSRIQTDDTIRLVFTPDDN